MADEVKPQQPHQQTTPHQQQQVQIKADEKDFTRPILKFGDDSPQCRGVYAELCVRFSERAARKAGFQPDSKSRARQTPGKSAPESMRPARPGTIRADSRRYRTSSDAKYRFIQ